MFHCLKMILLMRILVDSLHRKQDRYTSYHHCGKLSVSMGFKQLRCSWFWYDIAGFRVGFTSGAFRGSRWIKCGLLQLCERSHQEAPHSTSPISHLATFNARISFHSNGGWFSDESFHSKAIVHCHVWLPEGKSPSLWELPSGNLLHSYGNGHINSPCSH